MGLLRPKVTTITKPFVFHLWPKHKHVKQETYCFALSQHLLNGDRALFCCDNPVNRIKQQVPKQHRRHPLMGEHGQAPKNAGAEGPLRRVSHSSFKGCVYVWVRALPQTPRQTTAFHARS